MTEIKEYTEESFLKYLEYLRTTGVKKDLAYINELRKYERNINNFNTALSKFLLSLNLSDVLSLDSIVDHDQDLPQALDYANKAEIQMKDLIDDYKSHLFFIKGHIYARMEKTKESEDSFIKHVYFNSCKENYLPIQGYKFRRINEFSNIPLYSFRAINKYLISDLIKNEITLADPITFNDPFDTPLFNYLELCRRKICKKSQYDIKPLCDAYKYIKVRCFVKHNTKKRKKPFEDQLMWSHYADSHKGICIRYKFDTKINMEDEEKLIFSNWYKVDYMPKIDISDSDAIELGLLLATKNKCWEYENEVRLIHFDPECKENRKQISIIGSKIEAIFFGCRCPKEDKKMIKKIFPENTDIEFFEFPYNPEGFWNDTYKLATEDIKRFKMLG